MKSAANPDATGLTTAEAASRLAAEGYNELPAGQRRTLWGQVWGVVREPMFLLLLACGALYLLLGELQEALLLLGFVLVVMGITLYQEHKTERASKPCATSPARGRWWCATASHSAWPGARWCAAT